MKTSNLSEEKLKRVEEWWISEHVGFQLRYDISMLVNEVRRLWQERDTEKYKEESKNVKEGD